MVVLSTRLPTRLVSGAENGQLAARPTRLALRSVRVTLAFVISSCNCSAKKQAEGPADSACESALFRTSADMFTRGCPSTAVCTICKLLSHCCAEQSPGKSVEIA